MLNSYKLVIFDWDGTIMDSISHIVVCIQHAAEANGLIPPDEQSIKDIIGMSLPNAFETLFSTNFVEHYENFRSAYKEKYHTNEEAKLPLFDDVENLLETLQQKNKKLAVATGKGRPGLDKLMRDHNMERFFEFSRTSDEAQSKPSPDMLQQILDYFEMSASEAIMIGDSVHDLNMAKQAGMDRIGVSFGAHDKDKLAEFGPVAVIDSYKELLDHLI